MARLSGAPYVDSKEWDPSYQDTQKGTPIFLKLPDPPEGSRRMVDTNPQVRKQVVERVSLAMNWMKSEVTSQQKVIPTTCIKVG